MIFSKRTYCLLFLLLFSVVKIKAQVCTGSFGDPVVNISFANGNSNFGSPIPETNYTYVAGNPSDGQYTIVKTTAGLNSGWHQNVVNHTPNDPNGYFMVVNADYSQGIFYQKSIPVCPNTTYQFTAYIINILKGSGNNPKVKFSIEYNDVVFEVPAEEIPKGSAADWIRKSLNFTVPANVNTVTLKMTNENPGGIGNDLAIDDITFRACGPLVSSSVDYGSTKREFCEGKEFVLDATVSTGYKQNDYQWQSFNGTDWINMPNGTNKQTKVDLTGAIPGSYRYRIAVTEFENRGSVNCGVVSAEIRIDILNKPQPQANNVDGCVGNDITLGVSDASSYEWKDPKGIVISRDQKPIIQNAQLSDAGIYTVKVTNAAGCENSTQMTLRVEPKVVADVNISETRICEGESVQLIAEGATTYSWLPIEGLSNSKIANPIAKPSTTTIYTVAVSNGVCTDTKQVRVDVTKKAKANAGSDKKIIAGENTILDGLATGDDVSYYWTPTDYLDNPNKLNPIANPPATMGYTLHVISNAGCNVSTDNVVVTVFPKIEFPNTFSPNGDGVNDTWQIAFISLFPTARIKVVNRNGNMVFESTNGTAWDGKFNGKEQPTGTYYYTLYLNNEYPTYTGWLFLAR